MIIDDNSKDYKEQYVSFNNINIVQIKNEESIKNGFLNTDFKRNGHGWNKALYYFSTIYINYSYVWFIEDDVFFNNEKTLMDIDSQYSSIDLLTTVFRENKLGKKDHWHWHWIDIQFPPPYLAAMCCASRMSLCVLLKIKEYANTYKTLYFHEALSPTICQFYKYTYKCPIELRYIIYRRDYEDTDINETHLFHPIKDISKHTYYRTMLSELGKKLYPISSA
jgi:hypothetical protein